MARENLLFPAAGPEDGEAFAFESVGEQKASATWDLVAVAGRLMVFETPLSLYR